MTRIPSRRNFTLCKAALLVALLALAGWMGEVPVNHAAAQDTADPHRLVPATLDAADADCDSAWKGIAL